MSDYGIIPWEPVEAGIVGRLTLADARVYLVVCAHVRKREWRCFPGVETIARKAGLTTRAVQKATSRLVALGLFTVERGGGRGRDGQYVKTVYHLTGNPEHPFTVPKGLTPNAGAPNPEPGRTLTPNAGAPYKEEEPSFNNTGAAAPAAGVKSTSAPGKPKARKPDPWWDATCKAFGLRPVTKSDKSRLGKLKRDFKAKCEATGVGPDEIEIRRAALAAEWGGRIKVTPEALLKHWEAATGGPGAGDGLAADRIPRANDPDLLAEMGCPLAGGQAAEGE